VTSDPALSCVDAAAYRIPLEAPEADGTLTWDSTTATVVHVTAGGATGLGFTYGAAACAAVVRDELADSILGGDAMDVPGLWDRMVARVRNLGRPGLVSMAIAAVDAALWDLKARLMEVPLAALLGRVRAEVPLYGSGGFVSMDDHAMIAELERWVQDDGLPRVKIKIGEGRGSRVERDLHRIETARRAVGDGVELFVDANGGYTRKQAVRVARAAEGMDVRWFEEPVSSDDLEGLRLIRGMTAIDVAAGEYGSDLASFGRMLDAGAVDCLQADASRCAGITEWLRVAAIAAGHGLELSGHCAQSLHAHPACSIPNLRHLEYFADHARCERILFDGVLDPEGGVLRPDPSRHGMGLELKRADADRYRVA
jgi:L-alanine-DL-glutamate epimerase-like enolase superfamily enzyme